MHWIRPSIAALLIMALVGATHAEEEVAPLPRAPMSEATFAGARAAIEAFPFSGAAERWRKANLHALEQLRTVPLPDLANLDRLSLHPTVEGQPNVSAWGRVDGERQVVLVLPHFQERVFPLDAFTWIEKVDYDKQLAELVAFFEGDPARRSDAFDGFRDIS